jgi:hypothetical protein
LVFKQVYYPVNDQIETITRLAEESPDEVARIKAFLDRLSGGFDALAILLENLQANNIADRESAMIGILGQGDELSGMRRRATDAEERANKAEAAIARIVKILSGPSERIGDTVVAFITANDRIKLALDCAESRGYFKRQLPHVAPESPAEGKDASDGPNPS